MTPADTADITGLSAITLTTRDMARAVIFYEKLGFVLKYGGTDSAFTSFHAGSGFLNLIATDPDLPFHGWGRVIFHVADVDGFHARALDQGLTPQFRPEDAPWGERYFHITDPDGHELSFAKPL